MEQLADDVARHLELYKGGLCLDGRTRHWQAEIVEQYCRKGSQIYVEGSLQTRDWQDKDGNKRYTTEIVANEVQFLGSKDAGRPRDTYGGPPPPDAEPYSDSEDDDIPF